MFQSFEPIAICDKFICLSFSELESISLRESFYITLDLFVESVCLNAIQLG